MYLSQPYAERVIRGGQNVHVWTMCAFLPVRKVSCMKESWHEKFMHGNEIIMQENLKKNGNYAQEKIFLDSIMFRGDWAVHNFMHGILVHEFFGAKYSCIFMHGNFIFMLGNFILTHGNFIFMHENEIFMPRYFHARNLSNFPSSPYPGSVAQ